MDYNLRRGSSSLRSDVRHLLCLMSNNNTSATDELIEMLTRRVVTAVNAHLSNPDFVSLFDNSINDDVDDVTLLLFLYH